ncbi:Hpt domain-containing protein [Thiospirochaeta perfilievii]|uniref:Hpt domain-containing protein n=1 Tax=Thiospirochaeta perfilievii TaxID=252967 RepID=A0A5C1QBG8_9SPIO|nr:Hpt domain-containing protein [Thiospirochaeta perfilievii]QEN04857.1 Hpt domain-containing protein [Thiospirochaeta perfilievii]
MRDTLIDLEGLLHRTLNDPEFAKEILIDFLDETPEIIQSIKLSIINMDSYAIKKNAHTLKGTSASAGAIELYRISLLLEENSINKESVFLKNTFDQLKLCWINTLDKIKSLDIMK